MIDALTQPTTITKTTHTPVLATGVEGLGRINREVWQQTQYATGPSVIRVIQLSVSVYDSRGMITEDQPQGQRVDLRA